jgi:hypothetical protein
MIISCTPASLAAAMMPRTALGIEAADVLRDGAAEQFDVLRQIADMAAEHVGRPLVERGAVEPHLAAHRLPDADQRADQRRFAGAARADHAEPLPASSAKVRPARSALIAGGTMLTPRPTSRLDGLAARVGIAAPASAPAAC